MAVTETWPSPQVPSTIIHIRGISFYRIDRFFREGGVEVFVKNEFTVHIKQIADFDANIVEKL